MFKIKFRETWLQAILTFINSGFVGILLYHFYKKNLGLSDIFFADAIACGLNALILLVRSNIKTQRDMRVGFGILMLSLFTLVLIPYSKPVFYIFYIFQVLGGIAFYTPLNILYFANTADGSRMKTMAWYWIIGIITGIVGPLIGAYLFLNLPIHYFLVPPLILLAVGISATKHVQDITVPYTPKIILTRIRRVRLINMLDGALHRVNGDSALFVLMIVGSLAEYSGYQSIVALLMAVIAWIIAHNSDKTKKRMLYLVPAAIIAGIATIALSQAHSLITFGILTIIVRSALVISEPIRSNIMVDTIDEHPTNWIAREFYLNFGRSLVQLVTGILFVNGLILEAFIFFGALHLLFPLLVHYKSIYRTL